jgi:hypothetical protein
MSTVKVKTGRVTVLSHVIEVSGDKCRKGEKNNFNTFTTCWQTQRPFSQPHLYRSTRREVLILKLLILFNINDPVPHISVSTTLRRGLRVFHNLARYLL